MNPINEEEFKNVVSEKFKLYRKISQENVAEESNLSIDTISSIERAKSIISSLTLVKLCNALNITPNDILSDFIINNEPEINKKIKQEIINLSDYEKQYLIDTIEFIKNHRR